MATGYRPATEQEIEELTESLKNMPKGLQQQMDELHSAQLDIAEAIASLYESGSEVANG